MDDPRPLRADAERNRRRILDAARAVFAAQGTEAAVDEVARVAGVGVGTLYRRFPTKESLVEAILEDRLQAIGPTLRGAAESAQDPWGRFSAVLHAWAEFVVADRGVLQVISSPSGEVKALPAARAAIVENLAPVLADAQAAGAVRDDLVLGDVNAIVFSVARMPPWRLEQDPDAWRRQLAIVLDGMRPAAAAERLPLPAPPDWRPASAEELAPGASTA